jgi:RNA polymerase sigma-70 factor (ECF subfamily)
MMSDQKLAIAEALAILPAEYREAIVLREIEEMSYKEIARIQSIPIGTVMSRLARARQQLRVTLKRTINQ